MRRGEEKRASEQAKLLAGETLYVNILSEQNFSHSHGIKIT